jgi:hypothetical protein
VSLKKKIVLCLKKNKKKQVKSLPLKKQTVNASSCSILTSGKTVVVFFFETEKGVFFPKLFSHFSETKKQSVFVSVTQNKVQSTTCNAL